MPFILRIQKRNETVCGRGSRWKNSTTCTNDDPRSQVSDFRSIASKKRSQRLTLGASNEHESNVNLIVEDPEPTLSGPQQAHMYINGAERREVVRT